MFRPALTQAHDRRRVTALVSVMVFLAASVCAAATGPRHQQGHAMSRGQAASPATLVAPSPAHEPASGESHACCFVVVRCEEEHQGVVSPTMIHLGAVADLLGSATLRDVPRFVGVGRTRAPDVQVSNSADAPLLL